MKIVFTILFVLGGTMITTALNCDTLCVDIQGQDYDYTSIGFAIEIWDDECDQVEIIGNIYDNPELLEA